MVKYGRFNRTFMELKSQTPNAPQMQSYVLIVPLWNWNIDMSATYGYAPRFNRTFMELKCV